MQRRKFLKDSMLLGGVPLFLNNMPLKTMSTFNMPFTDADCAAIKDRVLVLVRMEGGNDGLNTIVPVSQYSIYKNSRPTLAIPDTGASKYITLDSSLPDAKKAGLHPSMTAFKDLYDAGKLNIVNGVGYADNNRSHFKATDLWLSAGDTTPELFDIGSGFMGRYLDFSFPGNINNPTPAMPDPLGLELGSSTASLGYKTTSGQYANILLTADAASFSTYVAGLGGSPVNPLPASQMGNRIAYIRNVELSINAYSNRITKVYNDGANLASYPADSYLSYQLRTVARLLKGGSKTKIFLVQTYGYDTHNNQVVAGSSTTGNHAGLLKDLTESIKAFQTDLQLLGLEDKVVTATFTEFGRTLTENANRGTDHGGVNNMFIIGKNVQAGVTGDVPDLKKVVDGGVMDIRYDYRSIYTSLLQDFLGAGPFPLAAAKLDSFQATKPVLFKATAIADPSCYTSIILPVTLTALQASLKTDGTVDVTWQTEEENNTRDFEIQKGTALSSFEAIGTLPAAGNSGISRKYLFKDATPFKGINLYRLKQSDLDGRFTYYGPVSVKVNNITKTVISISPNPAVGFLNIKITSDKNIQADIVVYDVQGHLIVRQQNKMSRGDNNYRISTEKFAKGYVIVMVHLEDGTKLSRQILCK
jgi:uncharacterized protein (DUF1501 family)